ncbi:transforming growth factor beta activator LRRC33 [Polyodon spathula]|nr:transforming growth factor beta activator LRRC33 [Polyodon spathula]
MQVLMCLVCLYVLSVIQPRPCSVSASAVQHHALCMLDQSTAWYNGCNLVSVPTDLPENLQKLHLDWNHIQLLWNSSLTRYTHLRRLSCTQNTMKTIQAGVFSSTPLLESLSLASNLLHSNYHELGRALRFLPVLKSLDLSQNLLTEDMISSILQNLTSLESLTLSGNLLMRLDTSIFSGLHQLQELNLERNMLYEIEDGAFENLKKLRRLSVAFNHLPCIVDFHLTQLEVLNASHNAIEWFLSYQHQEQEFQLQTLDLSDNKMFFFPLLPNRSRIQTLLLAENQINFYGRKLDNSSNGQPAVVQFVNLDGSVRNITTTYLWDETLHSDVSSLELLDMSDNSLRYLPQGLLSRMTSLLRLRLAHNCLESMYLAPVEIPDSLVELDLSHNQLSELQLNQSFGNLLPNLKFFNLSSNDLQQIPPWTFSALQNISSIDLSSNKIEICSSQGDSHCVVLSSIFSLRHLYLSDCDLQVISPQALEGSPITHLELSRNPRFIVRRTTFLSLSRTLEHLGLGNTNISDMDFSPFQSLRSLDISGNALNHLPTSLLGLSLRTLNLRDNKLSTILPGQARVLGQKIQSLLLGGNLFNCCQLDWWTIFREMDNVRIEDQAEVKCHLSTLVDHISQMKQLASTHCEKKAEMIWPYILLFLPVCLILLGVCLVFILSLNPKLIPRFIKKRCRRSASY